MWGVWGVWGVHLAESGQTKRYVLIPPVLTSTTAGSSAQLALHSAAPDWGLCVLARYVQAVITVFQLLFSHQTLRHCGDGNVRPHGGKTPAKNWIAVNARCEGYITRSHFG